MVRHDLFPRILDDLPMPTTSLNAISPRRFGFDQARHLLHRAGFGGTRQQIEALAEMGPGKAVDHLVDYERIELDGEDRPQIDPDVLRSPTPEERRRHKQARENEDEAELSKIRAIRNQRKAEDREQMKGLQEWWLRRIISTPRPLQEKLTLFWHGHFASNYPGCEDCFLLYQQNAMFRRHANGNFATLAHGIIRDPAMIVFLNNDRNRKSHPNENLARELMELFTLGEGMYSEDDIQEGARALTGYMRDDNVFQFRRRAHDDGHKELFGQRGNFDGEDFVRILLSRKACASFITYKLYRYFVSDLPDGITRESKTVMQALANDLRRNKYALKPLLKKLFLSEHFYDAENVGSQVRSPVHLLAGTARALETPMRDFQTLGAVLRLMGQELFNPPNVAGWPGGRTWINTSTLFTRQNVATYLITGKSPYDDDWHHDDLEYDAMPLIEHLTERTPEAVVDALTAALVCPPRMAARRSELLRLFADHDNRISNDMLIGALCLITAMPEYQLT
ncbi:MAG: hypothetical protein CMJ49_01335 [Planctomycetaceae bacterium]|nr:hypothetical protein [Planctomycetaceae bacterium]